MAEEQKPVVVADAPAAPAVEPTPAAPAADVTADAPAADKPVESAEPQAEEPAKTEGEAAAPVEEKKEEKPVEPIYTGALGYKAPGLKNAFRFSKKYFWFGEEPVPASNLSHYLRGEKPEVAHSVAAWSSQTGKGLLYFVKHADQKESPAGVLKLADATDLTKDGALVFHFKYHGGKHTFEAQNVAERNGWFLAFEKTIEEAKAASEGIVSSEGYKEQLEKLGKPATLAAAAAKEGSTPKKSTDATPKPAETTEPAAAASAEEPTVVPARTGSSSSSSSDEDKKKKKAKSKSRSASRGKRASIFGNFLGKKDKIEEKVEAKKEEKKEGEEVEAAKEETPAATEAPDADGSVAPVIAPVITEDLPKPVEETKADEPAVPVSEPAAEVKEEKKVEEKPKPAKRASIFGNFVEKLKSPTTEKKESELAPAVPAKETEVSAEPPRLEEPAAPAAAPAAEAAEAPKAEEPKAVATTPAKEKQHFSFGKFLGGAKEKVRSPSSEKAPEAPKVEEPAKAEETPAPIAPVEPIPEAAAEAAKEEPKEEEAAPAAPAPAATTTQKKRGSIFGNLTGSVKKDKDGEEKSQGLKGLFRNASKAGRSKKEKEPASAPAKVEETPEPKETATPAIAEEKDEAPALPAPTEHGAIGDVTPDAVTVGQAPKSTPPVATTA